MLTGLQSVHGFLLDMWIKSPRCLRSILVYLNMLADERNKVQLYNVAPLSVQFSTFSAEFLGWSSSFSHLWFCTTSRRRDGFSPLCPWLPGEPATLFFGWTVIRLLFRQETRKRSKYIHARERERETLRTREARRAPKKSDFSLAYPLSLVRVRVFLSSRLETIAVHVFVKIGIILRYGWLPGDAELFFLVKA